jgi:hypothetical protein
MPDPTVRPFPRADRDQLTSLVNAHLNAVTPAASVSVQALLSLLERDPGELLVDPWVRQRVTLVAEQRQRIVAAAHVLRYGTEDTVGEQFRGTGEIRWLVCWPPAPFWPDPDVAGAALLDSCLALLDRWGVPVSYADGSLPGPGVYGVPEQWPHIAELYRSVGYAGGRREDVLVATTADLRQLAGSVTGLQVSRTLGINGTRLTALRQGVPVGFIEVNSNLGEAGRYSRGPGWADVGNLHLAEPDRRLEVAGWLLARAADWLELGGIARLLTYSSEDDPDAALWLETGFAPLTRTRRQLQRVHHPR